MPRIKPGLLCEKREHLPLSNAADHSFMKTFKGASELMTQRNLEM